MPMGKDGRSPGERGAPSPLTGNAGDIGVIKDSELKMEPVSGMREGSDQVKV